MSTNPKGKRGEALFKVFLRQDSIHFASTFYYFISTMARTKQTARKHTGKVTVTGSARKVKTKLKRALLGSDPR